jgi:NADH:ubiquinone oxidoreductase subunit 5 (subunit L)/multisubunit Na+/H+ antiporter MnhA subunit
LKGYFSINPALALCLVITMFSFIGLPPLVGFFGKQMVLTSALDNNNTILVIVAILTSVIGAVYYLSIIKTIYLDKSDYKKSYIFIEVSLSNYLSISISILTLAILIFILIPNESLNLCSLLASSLYETIKLDYDEKQIYAFFNKTFSDNTIKYSYDILGNLLTGLCNVLAGLYIIFISLSENISSLLITSDQRLGHTSTQTTMDGTRIINLGYTTKLINNRYVVYDQNQLTGLRLTSLYAIGSCRLS